MLQSRKATKGKQRVLEETEVDTHGMKAEKTREMLGSHPDFKNKNSTIERFLGEEKKHMLPKYHCELNPIECAWAQAKRYLRAYCKCQSSKDYTPALESATVKNMQKHFRKSEALYVCLSGRWIRIGRTS